MRTYLIITSHSITIHHLHHHRSSPSRSSKLSACSLHPSSKPLLILMMNDSKPRLEDMDRLEEVTNRSMLLACKQDLCHLVAFVFRFATIICSSQMSKSWTSFFLLSANKQKMIREEFDITKPTSMEIFNHMSRPFVRVERVEATISILCSDLLSFLTLSLHSTDAEPDRTNVPLHISFAR